MGVWTVAVWAVAVWAVRMVRMMTMRGVAMRRVDVRRVAMAVGATRPAPAKAAAEISAGLHTASAEHTARVTTRVVRWTRARHQLHSAVSMRAT